MQTKKRSPIAAIVLAVVIGLLVIALLNGVIRPTQVVVAKVAIAPGTVLTDQLVELRTIPMGAKPADATSKIEDVTGKILAVGRTPGDLIVTSVLGEIASAGIPAELPEGHVALAIHVDLASGVAGLLRPGQTVTVIGMISPDILKTSTTSVFTAPIAEFTSPIVSLTPGVTKTPTPTPTPPPPASPLARLAITGVRVLLVPQSFRYEEVPAGASEEELFSSARTSISAQEGNVIVLDVPTGLIEVTPGFKVDPATLLAALDQYGIIHLALEPTSGLSLDVADVITLNLGELYTEMNDYRKKKVKMSDNAYQTNKITVMLAGAGHDVVYYQMQQPILADQRFMISGHAAQWSMFETNLNNLRPDLVIVQTDIAPDPDTLIRSLQKISAWRGIAIVVLPLAQKDFQGAFTKVDTVRGVFVAPVNWTEIIQAAYGAAMTARASLTQAAPMQQGVSGYSNSGTSAYITGTKRIAVLSHAGGSGCSTIAENLAYELSVRLSVKTLLVSIGLPSAAAPHLGLRYVPNLTEYFDRPGKAAFQAAIQRKENLEILLAPESSLEYMHILESSSKGTGEGSINGMLIDSEDGRYAAIVMDVPTTEDLWMMHSIIFANYALIVARPTLADLTAIRHTLTLLLTGLKSEKRLARDSIYLVLNQTSDRSSFTPRLFQEELSKSLGWAPPIAAIVPFDPGVPQAQDDGLMPVTRGDEFAKGIRAMINTLFPLVENNLARVDGKKGILRLPKIRFT